MNNRFYQTDRTKWFGRNYIGRPAKGKPLGSRDQFVGTWLYTDGGDPNSQAGRLGRAYTMAIEAVDELQGKRDQVEATGKYLPLGISELVGEDAMINAIPKVRRARSIVEGVRKEMEERAKGITLGKPSDETRKDHEEIRAAMRAMNDKQRESFLAENRNDPLIASAIAGAIPALSGVHPEVHKNIKLEQLKREHGDAISELDDLNELLEKASRATAVSRNELRRIVGVEPDIFEKIAEAGERNNGELPYRVEQVVQNGQVIEVSKVYDYSAQRWRNATADEITTTASQNILANGRTDFLSAPPEGKVQWLKANRGAA